MTDGLDLWFFSGDSDGVFDTPCCSCTVLVCVGPEGRIELSSRLPSSGIVWALVDWPKEPKLNGDASEVYPFVGSSSGVGKVS